TGQALVGEIKGNSHDRHPIGTAPAIGQITFRPEENSLGRQLGVEPSNARFQRGSFDLQPEVADAGVEQLVANGFPTVDEGKTACWVHGSQLSVARVGRTFPRWNARA